MYLSIIIKPEYYPSLLHRLISPDLLVVIFWSVLVHIVSTDKTNSITNEVWIELKFDDNVQEYYYYIFFT